MADVKNPTDVVYRRVSEHHENDTIIEPEVPTTKIMDVVQQRLKQVWVTTLISFFVIEFFGLLLPTHFLRI